MKTNINSNRVTNFNHNKYILSYYPQYNGSKSVYAVMKNDLPNHTKTVYQVYTLIEKNNSHPAIGIEDEFTVIKNKNNTNNNSLYSSEIIREKTIKTLSGNNEKEFRQIINKIKKTSNKKTNNKKTGNASNKKNVNKKVNRKKSKKTSRKRRPRNSKKGGYVSNCGDPALTEYNCIKPQWNTSCM